MTEQATQGRMEQAIRAAKNMDWVQVVLNGGPPCFHLFDDGFCGRAERWAGHGDPEHHQFISLEALLSNWAAVHREELAAAEEAQVAETSECLRKVGTPLDAALIEYEREHFTGALARHDQELTERVLRPVEALVAKWRGQAAEFEKEPTGISASANILICARELEALLKAGPR